MAGKEASKISSRAETKELKKGEEGHKTREDLLREVRELRDEVALLRSTLEEIQSKDVTARPTGTKRLLTALAALTIYNVIYFIPGFYQRILTFISLLLLAKLIGLPFAPLQVPSRRRVQMLVMLLTFAPLNMLENLTLYFAYLWYFRGNWLMLTPMLLYTVYIYFDRNPSRGGYRWCKKFCRNLWFHKFVAEYYPCKLIKTADLDPKNNYVFGYHPHGIIGVGAQANFGTDSTGFSELFPGIDMTLMTLKLTFKIPFFREWVMAHGLASCGSKSCDYILSSAKGGKALMIVIGGAAESLDARPEAMDLTLLNRKGFVRVALKNGAHLVPVISFGENEVFAGIPNERGSIIRKVQHWVQKKTGVAPVVFIGRGIFNYAFGVLPHRRAITSV
eukprot:CAMPEP_0184491880 /NCGR_PEP_ID=MMETSP0113_2-20130426/21602_1 /TAXON_ID=91329 /ORGANISM="Norrisiella sphaerica, Strain BC52" /LENGTH=390 /DNA_ID=CAMNT_0026876425 /DNA_START=90 /DNA_END=1258 /DNA_ORIENTATION=+